jgi:transposase
LLECGIKEAMKQNHRYSPELKAEVIRMVVEQGLKHDEISKRLSIPKGTIAGWLVSYKTQKGVPVPGAPSIEELAAENARLRKELTEARMEREILKKAAAYFARESMPGTRS